MRYIKVTISSTYGSWLYFTLTQVKVFGDGIFADAIKEVASPQKKMQQQAVEQGVVKYNFSFIEDALNQTQIVPEKHPDSCPNDVLSRLFHR